MTDILTPKANMTNLKDINFGLNQYCGPSVLSSLTGESTDRCAAVISAVSGKKEIKAVQKTHIVEALKRLRFSVENLDGGSTLFGVINRLHDKDGMYIIFVPSHVVAIEVKNEEIYICDNHTKTPIDIRQSARLTQRVDSVLKVVAKNPPKFVRSEIKILLWPNGNNAQLQKLNIYENSDDNTLIQIGQLRYDSYRELQEIINKLKEISEDRL